MKEQHGATESTREEYKGQYHQHYERQAHKMCEFLLLNPIAAKSKEGPFRVTTATELQNTTTTSYSNVNEQGMFQLTSVPMLSDAFITFLNSVVISTPNGSF